MTLDKRFKLLILQFLHKSLNHVVDCPELIEGSNFRNTLPNIGNKSLFYFPKITTKYKLFSPSHSLISTANTINN